LRTYHEAEPSKNPLSPGQRALWFLQRLAPQNPAYNIARAIRVRGPVDVAAVQRAWTKVAERHKMLRTRIQLDNGHPVQVVDDRAEVSLEWIDAGSYSAESLRDCLTREVRRPFDLASEYSLRIRGYTLSEDDHIGLIVMHHAMTDMWSLAILLYEFDVFYRSERGREPARLPFVPADYAQYVDKQTRKLEGSRGEALWEFWRERMSGSPPLLELPTDHPRPPEASGRCSVHTWSLDSDTTARISEFARAHGSNSSTLLTSVFQVLLMRYTGEDDILIGSPQAGRSARFVGTVGYFVNPVVLRADRTGDPVFADFLSRNTESIKACRDNSDYPFPLLVERLKPDRPLGRSPIFQVCFSWQKTTRLLPLSGFLSLALHHEGSVMTLGGNECVSYPLPEQVGPFDLTLLMAEADGAIKACFEYNPDLLDESTIQRMVGHFRTTLDGILADPSKRLSELQLLPQREKMQVLEWSRVRTERTPAGCLHGAFERRVAESPERVAVVGPSLVSRTVQEVTYGELEERSNRLARHLQSLGVGPEARVGICLHRSVEMIVAVLGVLKAGGAYVPLDPAHPGQRLSFMVEDAGISVLVTQSSLEPQLPEANGLTVIRVDTDWEQLAGPSGVRVESSVGPGNPAYVVYTSGSTGKPKGVLVEHGSVANLVTEQVRGFGVTATDRVLQFASPSFDAAVSEVFMALAAGAVLVLARQESLLPGPPLLDLLRRERITTVTLPPSVLTAMQPQGLPDLRAVVSAGEPCTWDIARRWSPDRRFFNAYGPTEATIGPTFLEVGASDYESHTVPIGRAIRNVRTYVLDERMEPVPVGVPGELWLGGVCVARGYLNQPELTSARFVHDPFGEPGDRLYRTGDRVRWLPDGVLEFLGRFDDQVKVRGFRIEPGEIEFVLSTHPEVQQTVVVARPDASGARHLAAYVVTTIEAESVVGTLKTFLRERLPAYMFPSRWVKVDEYPLTPSGKIDRRALASLDSNGVDGNGTRQKPQSEIERVVAAVWQEVLDLETIGVQDNFFEIGGHSLLAVTVHRRLEEVFEKDFSMVEMFRYPTIGTLAHYLRQNGASRPRAMGRQRGEQQKRALEQRHALAARASARRKSSRSGHSDSG